MQWHFISVKGIYTSEDEGRKSLHVRQVLWGKAGKKLYKPQQVTKYLQPTGSSRFTLTQSCRDDFSGNRPWIVLFFSWKERATLLIWRGSLWAIHKSSSMKETFIVFETGKREKGVVLCVLGITIGVTREPPTRLHHSYYFQLLMPTCHACPCSTRLAPQFKVLEASPW